MVTDFEELVALCEEELRHKEYRSDYYAALTKQWDVLRTWMKSKGLSQFNEEVGNNYCDEVFGTHLMPKNHLHHSERNSGLYACLSPIRKTVISNSAVPEWNTVLTEPSAWKP